MRRASRRPGSATTSGAGARSSRGGSPTSSCSTATRTRSRSRTSPTSRSWRQWWQAAGCTTRRRGSCKRHRTFDQIVPSPTKEGVVEAGGRRFDHLREHSIGLPQVLFQSITHMAPAAAVAYSIYISVPDAGASLPLAVFIALAACLLAASSIGQLAKELPSAGGLYT